MHSYSTSTFHEYRSIFNNYHSSVVSILQYFTLYWVYYCDMVIVLTIRFPFAYSYIHQVHRILPIDWFTKLSCLIDVTVRLNTKVCSKLLCFYPQCPRMIEVCLLWQMYNFRFRSKLFNLEMVSWLKLFCQKLSINIRRCEPHARVSLLFSFLPHQKYPCSRCYLYVSFLLLIMIYLFIRVQIFASFPTPYPFSICYAPSNEGDTILHAESFPLYHYLSYVPHKSALSHNTFKSRPFVEPV